MKERLTISPQLLLRSPVYHFQGYDHSRLSEVLSDHKFQQAIYLASPDFYKVLADKAFDFCRLSSKEIFSVTKYYCRMCFRPTPFGSFAFFSLTGFGEWAEINFDKSVPELIRLLPDNGAMIALRQIPGYDNEEVSLNPTLYKLGKHFRYIKTLVESDNRYGFSIQTIDAEIFYKKLFASFKKDKVTSSGLTQWIIQATGCDKEEANSWLDFLVTEQIIYRSLWGGTIIPDPFEQWPEPVCKDLKWLNKKNAGPVADLITLDNKVKQAQPLLEAVPQLFYAASEKLQHNGTLSANIQEELLAAVKALRKLALPAENTQLKQFIKAFEARFERQKVPLLLALDPDYGIAYPAVSQSGDDGHVLEGLQFRDNRAEKDKQNWTAVHRLLMTHWQADVKRSKTDPLIFDDDDLVHLDTPGIFPPSLGLLFRATAENLLIESAAGVTALSLVGRFSVFSEHVYRTCRDIASREIELNPDVAFADINHLSGIHVDNINKYRPIYPYEIPLNSWSGTANKGILKPADLVLFVENGELILESVRLKIRVIPRLVSAYNYTLNNLAVFRLLCDLQFQSMNAALTFSLENYFPGLNYYPRVQFQHTVISLAKWIIKKENLTEFSIDDPEGCSGATRNFRKKYQVPRWISLGATDQQLVFDLSVPDEAAFFWQCTAGKDEVIIQEYLLPDRSVKEGNRPLAAQFTAIVQQNVPSYPRAKATPSNAINRQKRSFSIGSEWTYLKLYCTPESSNDVLTGIIKPFVSKYAKTVRNWFFIRYADDGYHIRFRFLADTRNIGTLLSGFNKVVAQCSLGLLRSVTTGEYHRELERYGILPIENVERFFLLGSRLMLNYLSGSFKTGFSEFQLAIVSANIIIVNFIPTIQEQIAFVTAAAAGFMNEFKADKQLRLEMDRKFRLMKPALELMMLTPGYAAAAAPCFQTLGMESLHLAELVTSYPKSERHTLLADLVHMQMNRTFSMEPRKQEMLVYYFLLKIITGLKARNAKNV